MRERTRYLRNAGLSFAISVTVVLTLASADGRESGETDGSDRTWDRRAVVVAAGVSAFVSGVCASYFGRRRRNYL